jgi:hypothetical protein
MNFEHFKKEIDRIIGSMTTQELQGELIKHGAKLMRVHENRYNIMTEEERILEEFKQEAFETVGDYYYEDAISKQVWEELVDKIEEAKSENELVEILKFCGV